jgi:hypothetical protein
MSRLRIVIRLKLLRNLVDYYLILSNVVDEFNNRNKISNLAIYTLITNIRIILSFNLELFREKMKFKNLIFGKISRLRLPLI